MTMSTNLKNFLNLHQVDYQLVPHRYTDTARNTASTAHIAAACIVKGVLLHDDEGYLMAAIGADSTVDIDRLNEQTGRNLTLAPEDSLSSIFSDCKFGAVPALGQAWGIETLWDEKLGFQPGFYIEAGNHEELVRLSYFDFMGLMGNSADIDCTN